MIAIGDPVIKREWVGCHEPVLPNFVLVKPGH